MNTTICDRCGKTIGPGKKALLTTREIKTQAFLLPPGALENISYDLCPRCALDFREFMAGVPVDGLDAYEDYP